MNAKLTAYALNELPPDERAALEAEMETNPAMRVEAEEMRKFCTLLHDEVTDADKTTLTSEQRFRVLREFGADTQPQPKKAERSVWKHPAFWVPTAIAACTTVMLVVNLKDKNAPNPEEIDQLVELRLAERTKGKPSAQDVRVNFEKSGKSLAAGQTPAPGLPDSPILVAANTPTFALDGGSTPGLPPMPATPAPASPVLSLPASMDGSTSSVGLLAESGGVAMTGELQEPLRSSELAIDLPPVASRGIAIGTTRPMDRYQFSLEKLGEMHIEPASEAPAAGGVNGNRTGLASSSLGTNTLPKTEVSGSLSLEQAPTAWNDLSEPTMDFSRSTPPPPPGTTPFPPGTAIGIFGAGVLADNDDAITDTAGAGYLSMNGAAGGAPALGDVPIMGRTYSGNGGISKSGAGTLELNGVNTYTGGTTIISGKIIAGAPAEVTGTVNINGAVNVTSGGAISRGAAPIAGSGGVAMQATNGTPVDGASGNSTFAGTIVTNQLAATPAPATTSAMAPTAAPAPVAHPAAAKPVDKLQASVELANSMALIKTGDGLLGTTSTTSVSSGNASGLAANTAPKNAPTTPAAPAAASAMAISNPEPEPLFAYSDSDSDVTKKATASETLTRGRREQELERLGKELKDLKQLNEAEKLVTDFGRRRAGGETYTPIYENPFLQVAQQPLSTFSIDVDTASYANVRRFLNNGQRPPADAVRLEELINYFPYSYEPPAEDGAPFSVTVDMAEAPWQPMHRLARIALKGREIRKERGAANFVFLVDVSGSMDSQDKLPLVKQSLRMLTEQLKDTDRVAIVTYAGDTGVALSSTPGSERQKIQGAIEALNAGGSTNGAGGIRMAYQQAAQNFIQEGVNRVILCTDGDFNVGISSPEELEKLITEKAKSRVFLSVLGYGTGNLKDRTMETLADKGNGNYAYIDSLSEARKVLVDQMNATLVTIAKDVKIQVEFNPNQVAAYRLLGYENRALAKEDFNNDRKDAGEIGAGHTVTALYEIVPVGARNLSPDGRPAVDDLKYAPKPPPTTVTATPAPGGGSPSKETMTVKLRYKQPEGDKSQLIEVPVTDKEQTMANAPRDFVFAASVTGFGMILRNSQYSGELTWDMVREMALRGKGDDPLGYRGEFLQLIDKARGLMNGQE